MAKPKVLISDELSPRAVEIFAERGCDVDFKPGLKPAELRAIVGDYDGLAIRSATKVTAEVLAEAKKLKVVGRAGIGVDNVDIKSATAHGVVVMNTPFGNAITTAEHAIALMFARGAPDPRGQRLDPGRQVGEEPLHGHRAQLQDAGPDRLRQHRLDRRRARDRPEDAGDRLRSVPVATSAPRSWASRRSTLDQLLARADFITVHTPLTEQTKNILSRANLMKTKKGVRIINCARGGLVDELAVRDLLVSGHIAGAGFDVFTEEPAKEQRAVRRAQPRLHAASRRLDRRGAGERGAAGRRADVRLPADRRGRELAQHAQRLGRGRAQAARPISSSPRSSARSPASSPRPASRRCRSSTRARSRRSTSSR